jgi:stage II sporulation protein D (peptidoglycan lytic transglycosylase)
LQLNCKFRFFLFPYSLFLIFLFLFFFIAKGQSSSLRSQYKETMVMAEALLNRGFFSEALTNFEIVAAKSKSREQKARALYYKGKINSIYLDQPEKALHIFKRILTTYPESSAASDAFFESGIILFDRENYEKAHSVFTRFGKTYPGNPRQKSAEIWADISKELYKNKRKTNKKPKIEIEKKDEITPLRVLVKHPSKRIEVLSAGNIVISDNTSGKMYYSGWGPLILAEKNNKILINGSTTDLHECRIRSDANDIKVNGSQFRGFFTIHTKFHNLYTINHVNLEEYLYGVIPEEMPTRWDKQALMAQAVAARTYALCMKTKNRHEEYDIKATTAAQVYGGYSAENIRTTTAVNNTRGQVMTHNGRLIVAYFHSNSGGHTEDPVNVWNVKIPYLRAVPDNFSMSAPGNAWEFFLSYQGIKTRLHKNGIPVGPIKKLQIVEKSPSGRNRKIRIVTEKGVVNISGNMFRASIGEAKIKSTLFTITPYRKGIYFKGRGFGHGVGMSQWGARKMAMKGVNYKDILKYYYQDIRIVKMDNLHVNSA